jgi:hypothetical protein
LPILFHDFDFAPGKIIFQAFSLCAFFNREIHEIREWENQFYFRVFGVFRGQPIFFQFVPPPLRVKFFA